MSACISCDGDGFDGTGWQNCRRCSGTGTEPRRHICWFSCGAASAVATKLYLADHPHAEVMRIDTGSEHPDGERFMGDCADWFGKPITVLKSDKYADVWQVWDDRRFIVGQQGAPCTIEMKKKVREKHQRPNDINVFGYTAEEAKRHDRFVEQNPGVEIVSPLIQQGVTRADCYEMLSDAGIELHVMYRLGYQNANCLGCPKGGMGYWNKIRVDFPETFDRMARLERKLDHAILTDRRDGKRDPLFLDALEPGRGNYGTEPDSGCSLNCTTVEGEA